MTDEPFVQSSDGISFKLREMTFIEGYYRLVLDIWPEAGLQIASADVEVSTAETGRGRVLVSENPNGGSRYVFDGLLRGNGMDVPLGKWVIFNLSDGRKVRIGHEELIASEPFYNPAVIALWREIATRPPGLFLEIGGRGDTSIGLRGRIPEGWRYLSVDIHPGPNVDLVADAHRLSQVIGPGSVDVYYSSSTYEHLAQPWLAAIEANKVLRLGGLAFTDVPQAFPLHAKPWDFWRYSPWSWEHVFSQAAGFEILEVGKYCECRTVPIVMRDWNNQQIAHEGGSWLGVACLARKCAETELTWNGYSVEGDYPLVSDFRHHQ